MTGPPFSSRRFCTCAPPGISPQREHDIPSSEQHERLRKLYFDLVKGDTTVKVVDGSKRLEEANYVEWIQVNDRLGGITRR